jgi:hypothetical protein
MKSQFIIQQLQTEVIVSAIRVFAGRRSQEVAK